jgi:hypothetical protein
MKTQPTKQSRRTHQTMRITILSLFLREEREGQNHIITTITFHLKFKVDFTYNEAYFVDLERTEKSVPLLKHLLLILERSRYF